MLYPPGRQLESVLLDALERSPLLGLAPRLSAKPLLAVLHHLFYKVVKKNPGNRIPSQCGNSRCGKGKVGFSLSL